MCYNKRAKKEVDCYSVDRRECLGKIAKYADEATMYVLGDLITDLMKRNVREKTKE